MTTPQQPINDGGPAFPPGTGDTRDPLGLTKREWFAGMALQGLLANAALYEVYMKDDCTTQDYVEHCCYLAEDISYKMLAQKQSTK